MKEILEKLKMMEASKIVIAIVSFILIAITIACLMLPFLTNKTIENNSLSQDNPKASMDIGGMKVNESVNNGISLMSTKLATTQYATYGIENYNESAFVLNATITPETAGNKGVDWVVSWANSQDEFAQGKVVTDYVKVTPLADNQKSATVECLSPFGAKIVVTAISKDNPDLSANCKLDYAQKITNVTVNIGNIPVKLDGVTEVKYEICPTKTGSGGVIEVSYQASDVYTIKENFVTTVDFILGQDTESWFHINDLYPTNIEMHYREVDNWVGEELYFDYMHDMCDWIIFQRSGDIVFEDLTTEEIIGYMSNITNPRLGDISVSLVGTYSSYSYTSTINCIGYTNDISVNGIDLDTPNYVF